MGVFVEAAPRPGLLPALYQMDKPGEGSVQTRRLQGCLQVMGTAQKQARHELRDYGEGLKVCRVTILRLFSLFYKETKIFLQAKEATFIDISEEESQVPTSVLKMSTSNALARVLN